MAKDVMENIGLFDIVELMALADEIARGKAAVSQMVKEGVVRNQAGDRNYLPAGFGGQALVQFSEIRDTPLGQAENIEAGIERLDRTASERTLLEEQVPDRMLFSRKL